MERETKDRIIRDIEELENNESLSPRDAEDILMKIINPLLAENSYVVEQTAQRGIAENGFDFIAKREQSAEFQANTIGILQKHYKSNVSIDVIRQLIGASILQGIDRAMLITNTGFTSQAREIVKANIPVQLELLDIENLKEWIDRIELNSDLNYSQIIQIFKKLSRKLAILIAENPRYLDEVEWRDLERILAEVFEGIGFSVELTPSSKDGGKDLILECNVNGNTQTYIVEVKHWRSGNRVGLSMIKDFLNVVVREHRMGGLFLSTYGYCENLFESLSEIERQQLKLGNEEKIVSLCKTYVKTDASIWSPPENLPEILFESTH